jgi:hypothetical protein
MNGLWTCLRACDIAGGATVTPTCGNANAKRLLCDQTAELPCSDTDPVDQCLNKCVLDYPCDQWEPRMGGDPTAFQNCYNGCAASVGTSSPNFVVSEGGYVTTLTWHGYAWTATDGKSASTISPADFSTLPAGRQLCASGTVVGTSDYSAVAMLGFVMGGICLMFNPVSMPIFWIGVALGVTSLVVFVVMARMGLNGPGH